MYSYDILVLSRTLSYDTGERPRYQCTRYTVFLWRDYQHGHNQPRMQRLVHFRPGRPRLPAELPQNVETPNQAPCRAQRDAARR